MGLFAIYCTSGMAATSGGLSEIQFNCEYLNGTWVGESGEGENRYSWKVELKLVETQDEVSTFQFKGEFFDHNDIAKSKQYGYDRCDGKKIASVVRVEGGDLDGMEVEWTYKIINLNRTEYVYQYLDGSGNGPVFRSKRPQ